MYGTMSFVSITNDYLNLGKSRIKIKNLICYWRIIKDMAAKNDE